jgi:hypothetical protein
MAIPFQCPCGQRLQAPDDQSGNQMRCPACRELVRVPAAGGEAPDGYAVEKVRKCPGCKREWPLDAVICVDCGYNFETGRKMKTKYKVPDRVLDVGAVWAGTYTRYRVYRDARGKPRLDITKKFLFLPVGGASHDLSAYRAVLTDYAVGDEEESVGTFYLKLAGPGQREVRIFRSSDEEAMKELIDLVVQAGRLEIKRE